MTTTVDPVVYGPDGPSLAWMASPWLVARWPVNAIRYFAISPSGSDVSRGYSDVSSADAWTVPLLSWSGLMKICPELGNGRRVRVLIGGSLGSENIDCRPFVGYSEFEIIDTGDGSGSAYDLTVGAATKISPAGDPNGDGSWTCAAGWTNASGSGATGGFFTGAVTGAFTVPSDPTLVGKRIRFPTISTAPGATQCVASILKTVAGAGGTIVGGSVLMDQSGSAAPAPATGDKFFIEKPGITTTGDIYVDLSASQQIVNGGSSVSGGFLFKGISANHLYAQGNGARIRAGFCEFTSAPTLTEVYTTRIGSIPRIGGAAIPVGTGMTAPSIIVSTSQQLFADSMFMTSTTARSRLLFLPNFNIGAGSRFMAGLTLGNCGLALAAPSPGVSAGATGIGSTIGVNSGNVSRYNRMMIDGSGDDVTYGTAGNGIVGPLIVASVSASLIDIDITNAGTSPAIKVLGHSSSLMLDAIAGTSGNQHVGLDTGHAFMAQICVDYFRYGLSVSGTLGDLRIDTADAYTTWASFDITNVMPKNGALLFPDNAQNVVGQCYQIINKNAGALVIGDIVRKHNSTDKQADKAYVDAGGTKARDLLGVMVTPPAANAYGYFATGPVVWTNFVDASGSPAVPTVGRRAYLSKVAGAAVDVPYIDPAIPVIPLGTVHQSASSNRGLINWSPGLPKEQWIDNLRDISDYVLGDSQGKSVFYSDFLRNASDEFYVPAGCGMATGADAQGGAANMTDGSSILSGSAAVGHSHFSSGGSAKWLMAIRARSSSAPAGGDDSTYGVKDNTGGNFQCRFGIIGASSTTAWALAVKGQATVTGGSIDQLYHNFIMYHDGSYVVLYIDGVLIATVSSSGFDNNAFYMASVFTGASFITDKYATITPSS